MMEGQIKYPAFGDYRGAKCWEVVFNGKACITRAPDDQAAIIAAANGFGQNWRDPNYHGFATVTRRKDVETKLRAK